MKIIISNNIKISDITKEEREVLRRDLTIPNTEYFNNIQFGRPVDGIDKYVVQYSEENENAIVPRGYLYNIVYRFGMPDSIEDNTAHFEPIQIPSKIKLKPLQIPWVEGLLKHRQGFGVAPPGSGKTVMSLEVISRLGQPTLWLTHRQLLASQVQERIDAFLDVGKIGLLGDGDFYFGDIITVGMTPTLAKRDLSDLTYRFGAIIVDEAHHSSSPSFLSVVRNFAPRYLYGITATPFRSDKMERVMFNLAGPIVVSMDRQEAIKHNNIMQPTVKVRNTGYDNPHLHHTPNVNMIMRHVAKNKNRNAMIISDIVGELKGGNICIVLTVTVKHGLILHERISELGFKSVHIHSKLNNKQALELKENFLKGEVNVLFATYSLVAEGFDHVATNRLFLAGPRCGEALIDQATGRVERVSEGKEDAIIYDYVDEIPMLKKQFYKRMDIYKRKGIKIS
jgi:superfamily II DNA or RNA helicase